MAFGKLPPSRLGLVVERILCSVAAVLLFTSCALSDADAQKPDNQKPVNYAALLEDIVNRANKAPEIVKQGGMGTFPVFFEDYDYEEQLRVRSAIEILTRASGNELWPHLIASVGDDRYALTCSSGPEDDFARSLTVGIVCRGLAEQCIDWPCEQYKPKGVPRGVQRATHSFPRKRDKGMRADEFAAWAKEQQGKSLDALQIEQCKYVIDNAEKLRGFSAAQKDKYIGQLHDQVAELERTGMPIVTGTFARAIQPLRTARIESYQSKYGGQARSQFRERQAQKKKIDETNDEKSE